MDRNSYARSNAINSRPYRRVWHKKEKRLKITPLVLILNGVLFAIDGTNTNCDAQKCLCVMVGLVYPAYSANHGSYRQKKSWEDYWLVLGFYLIFTLIMNGASSDSVLYWVLNVLFLSWCVDNRSELSTVSGALILFTVCYLILNTNKDLSVHAPYETETNQFTSPVMDNGTGMCPAWPKTLNQEFDYMHEASKEVNN